MIFSPGPLPDDEPQGKGPVAVTSVSQSCRSVHRLGSQHRARPGGTVGRRSPASRSEPPPRARPRRRAEPRPRPAHMARPASPMTWSLRPGGQPMSRRQNPSPLPEGRGRRPTRTDVRYHTANGHASSARRKVPATRARLQTHPQQTQVEQETAKQVLATRLGRWGMLTCVHPGGRGARWTRASEAVPVLCWAHTCAHEHTRMHTYMGTCAHSTHVHTNKHTCAHTCVSRHVRVCTCAHTCACTPAHLHTLAYVCLSTHVCVHKHTCAHARGST